MNYYREVFYSKVFLPEVSCVIYPLIADNTQHSILAGLPCLRAKLPWNDCTRRAGDHSLSRKEKEENPSGCWDRRWSYVHLGATGTASQAGETAGKLPGIQQQKSQIHCFSSPTSNTNIPWAGWDPCPGRSRNKQDVKHIPEPPAPSRD